MVTPIRKHIDDVIIRPVEERDAEAIARLGNMTGPGMLIPLKAEQAALKIKSSMASFAGEFDDPEHSQDRVFWLVAEDTRANRILGMSAIKADVGVFPAFKLVNDRLEYSEYLSGQSELCLLFTDPQYRRYDTDQQDKTVSIGRALSLARFMLMKAKPEWFASGAFAEIRGYQSSEGVNDFYNKVWKGTLKQEFAAADQRLLAEGPDFLLAHTELYENGISLDSWKPEEVGVIARPHDNSYPAIGILKHEGFENLDSSCDFLCGGPHFFCGVPAIRSVENTKPLADISLDDVEVQDIFAIANGDPSDFRIAFVSSVTVDGVTKALERVGADMKSHQPLMLEFDADH